MHKTKPLVGIIPWAHELISEVLKAGDLAVDLTAGNGYDTLFLHRSVGSSGKVLAFDIQEEALESTTARLRAEGVEPRLFSRGDNITEEGGVELVLDCHRHLKDYVHGPVKAFIANLGFFPSGSRTVTTMPETTKEALENALELLDVGGRIAVVVYIGHCGGAEEGKVVDALFEALPSDSWQVLRLVSANRKDAPYLYVAEKRRGKNRSLPEGFRST